MDSAPENCVVSNRVMAAGLCAITLALSATAPSPEKARPSPEAECSATWKPAE